MLSSDPSESASPGGGSLVSSGSAGAECMRFGKYEVGAKIGQGAMGAVYRGRDPILARDVAIKTIAAPMGAVDLEIRERFLREAQSGARLNHPNIITVYDFGEEQDLLYMVMELLDGEDLKTIIARRAPLPLATKLDLIGQICGGLAFAHANGVVHRDLKPANIHVTAAGQVKILDFGLARLSASDLTRTGIVMGTPNYMSPEQVRGDRSDARSDVFSLGCVLYELLSGRRAFDADSMHAVLFKVMQAEPDPLEKVAPDVPVALGRILEKTLRKDPAERFRDAGELLAALQEIQADPASDAPKPVLKRADVASRPRQALPMPPAPATVYPRLGRAPSAPATAAVRIGTRRVESRDPWASLLPALPLSMKPAAPTVRAFLGSLFRGATSIRGNLLRLQGASIPGAEGYAFFALFMGCDFPTGDDADRLGTQTFIACSVPLESHLGALQETGPKVVVAIADSFELGRGVRERILHYRRTHNAVVLPLYLGELRTAHRTGALRELFIDRLADFHTTPDLYASRGPSDPTTFFGMRETLNQVVADLERRSAFVVITGPPGSGKTSLVSMAEYGLQARRFVTIRCSDAVHRSVPGIVAEIASALAPSMLASPPTLLPDATLAEAAPPAPATGPIRKQLASAARTAAERGSAAGERPVLVLEDADWLIEMLACPKAAEADRNEARELWTSLGEQARGGRLPILVTSVQGFLLAQRRIAGWENPVAEHATVHAISGLTPSALKRMVGELAVQMNFSFSTDALDEVYALSAGNLEVARRLCSRVVRSRRTQGDVTLAPAKVGLRDVRVAAEDLASVRSTFQDTFLAWLGPVELQVLRVVADRRPRSSTVVQASLLGEHPAAEVREALERLRQMGLVDRQGGREQVTIPLLGEWVRRTEEKVAGQAETVRLRRMRYVAVGLSLITLLFGAYGSWSLMGPTLTPAVSWNRCPLSVAHPKGAAEKDDVSVFVYVGPCATLPSAPLSLVSHAGTVASLDGRATGRVPVPMSCEGARCFGHASFRLDMATQDAFTLDLAAQGEVIQPVRIRKDALAAFKQRIEDVVRCASMLLALLTPFLGLQQEMLSYMRRLKELLPARLAAAP